MEVLAILEACLWQGHDLVDIEAAIKTIYSAATAFRLAEPNMNALKSLGNTRADGLVGRGPAFVDPSVGTVCVLLTTVKDAIYTYYLAAAYDTIAITLLQEAYECIQD